LRTLLWGWRGRKLEPETVAAVRQLRTDLDAALCHELSGLLTRRKSTQHGDA